VTDLYQTLHQEAKALFQPFHGTPEALIALAHAGFRAWAKAGNLNFPEEKRYALLHEVLRYCADRCLLACLLLPGTAVERDRRGAGRKLSPLCADSSARVCAAQSQWKTALLTPLCCKQFRLSEAARCWGKAKFSI
jgi:hypothetical protein